MVTRRVLAAALAVWPIVTAGAQTPARSEYEVKAAYLYTFGRFVEWPADRAAGAFTICVLGTDPFGPVLEATLKGTRVRGRSVVARRIDAAESAGSCHVLFISASEDRRLENVLARLPRADVLTVSDVPEFVGRGGMIEFETAANRVRFRVDLPQAQSGGLTLSSELLRVATSVRREGLPGE